MTFMLLSSFVAISIPFIVFILAIISSMRVNAEHEKSSPFECGFDPYHFARIPFSLRFFLLAIIFIVFDIEIVLLIPAPILINSTNSTFIAVGLIAFLRILILGLLHE